VKVKRGVLYIAERFPHYRDQHIPKKTQHRTPRTGLETDNTASGRSKTFMSLTWQVLTSSGGIQWNNSRTILQ